MVDLVFDAPIAKKKTPIHLEDLTVAERKERAEELGLPAFRANQLAVHFFTHHNDDVESFTDIPPGALCVLPADDAEQSIVLDGHTFPEFDQSRVLPVPSAWLRLTAAATIS